MSIDKESVRRWLDAYVRAWETYDPKAIGDLFSETATYAWHPWDKEVPRGREAIVKAWLDNKDKPGTYKADYAPLAVDGDLVIATGQTSYFRSSGSLKRQYYNCFVMRFDSNGQCTEFTEWFMKTPAQL